MPPVAEPYTLTALPVPLADSGLIVVGPTAVSAVPVVVCHGGPELSSEE